MHRTYNPKQVILTYAGANLEGWESITVKRNSPQSKQIPGIWGKSTKITNYQDTSATLDITVAYGSETNKIFAMLVELDAEMQGGVKLNILLKDAQGDGIQFSSADAYLEGMPEEGWSGSAGSKTWKILCDTSDWRLSSDPTSDDSLIDKVLSLL